VSFVTLAVIPPYVTCQSARPITAIQFGRLQFGVITTPQEMFFLRAESFYNLASYIDEVGAQHSYGGTSLHRMSHGESFLNTLVNRLSGRGLYLLDEPERDFFMSHAAIVESMMQASDLDAADHKQ
jgi:predicted ATPase